MSHTDIKYFQFNYSEGENELYEYVITGLNNLLQKTRACNLMNAFNKY